MVSLLGREAELTTFVGRGEISLAEVLEAYSDFLVRAPTRLVLWDVMGATLTDVKHDQSIWVMAAKLALLAQERRAAGRTAVVCGPEGSQLARVLVAYLGIAGYPVLVNVFGDVAAARAWLLEEPTR